MQAPSNSGSSFFNYKRTHSIVLMAVRDAYYRFILIDIGDAGRHSDGGVFSNSTFGKAVIEGNVPLPPDCSLPSTSQPDVPYVIVGDATFLLNINLMRPYPGRNLSEPHAIFNSRLNRASRVIENSFGILAARWCIFRRPIIAKPDNVVVYTKASIALHNFLRTTESSVYCPPGFIDSEDADGNVICGSWETNKIQVVVFSLYVKLGVIITQDLLRWLGTIFVHTLIVPKVNFPGSTVMLDALSDVQ